MAVTRNIKYLNKDFSEYRASLIDYAKTYYEHFRKRICPLRTSLGT